jgi:hypothetical protein
MKKCGIKDCENEGEHYVGITKPDGSKVMIVVCSDHMVRTYESIAKRMGLTLDQFVAVVFGNNPIAV